MSRYQVMHITSPLSSVQHVAELFVPLQSRPDLHCKVDDMHTQPLMSTAIQRGQEIPAGLTQAQMPTKSQDISIICQLGLALSRSKSLGLFSGTCRVC